MGSFSVIAHAATQAVKANPIFYVPIKRCVFPLIQAARHLMVRFAAFAFAQQPLTRFLLTPVRMDSIANLEVTGELANESIHVRTIFPDEALFDRLQPGSTANSIGTCVNTGRRRGKLRRSRMGAFGFRGLRSRQKIEPI